MYGSSHLIETLHGFRNVLSEIPQFGADLAGEFLVAACHAFLLK
jgi:hypothetical protein